MHDKKIANVLSMSPEERLGYFVRKVSDFEEVWGLFDDGWTTSETDDGAKVISFWPEQAFADKCAVEQWSSYLPKVISLSDFIEKWLPGMEKDGVLMGIFQTPENKAVVLAPSELLEMLNEELENY